MARSLYICYFGLGEPLVQTQVLPYLRELRKDGHEIALLTFEPAKSRVAGDYAIEARDRLAADGIDWHSLRYHKRLSVLATAFDILCGAILTRRIIRDKQLDILHARVHIPALMAALARKLSQRKPKILFDIRGFMPEEYTDAGIWREDGWLFRIAKRIERWLLKDADGFVVLTEKARAMLFPESLNSGLDELGRPVEVIPCCVDLSRFSLANGNSPTELQLPTDLKSRFVVAYVGALGGWYLTEQMADFFGEVKAKRPDAFALVLTQSSSELILPLLRERGYDDNDLLIAKVPPSEIPSYLSAADLAVSFIKPCYSKQASSPTKNAEYLAVGLPIVANGGVGDVERLINDAGVGAIVAEFSPRGYSEALDTIEGLGEIGERCRATAHEQFDLGQVAGIRYRRLYRRILEN